MARYTPVNQIKPPAKSGVTSVSAGGRPPQISPPPVYRPSQSSVALQSKVIKPSAPPVYRPENIVPRALPPVMQPKMSKVAAPPVYQNREQVIHGAPGPAAGNRGQEKPPIYRPNQVNALSAQLKPANNFRLENCSAPPVYRPQVMVPGVKPPVMQPMVSKVIAPPVYRPQDGPTRLQATAGTVPTQALKAGTPPVYSPQQTSPPQQITHPTGTTVAQRRLAQTPRPAIQPRIQSGPRPWLLQNQLLQLSKRKREEPQTETRKRRKTAKNVSYKDQYSYMDKKGYGENPDYGKQLESYSAQQVEKKQTVTEDPDATQIIYETSKKDQSKLEVHTMTWMKENWGKVKGNLEFGTYATSITVGDNPFFFRAQNTMDVGLSLMSVGNSESTVEGFESVPTYTSAKARNFTDIGDELDFLIGKAKKSDRGALRAEIGRSILEAIKSEGKTTPDLAGLKPGLQLLVKELIAELAAIWILDLYRSEGNEEKVLEHQKELLTGKLPFADILKPGVYLGMKAKDLR